MENKMTLLRLRREKVDRKKGRILSTGHWTIRGDDDTKFGVRATTQGTRTAQAWLDRTRTARRSYSARIVDDGQHQTLPTIVFCYYLGSPTGFFIREQC